MKWVDSVVTFSEIPDEITLCISISNCPYHCPGCHSSYLTQDIGEELTPEVLENFILQNPGISCICLMGGKETEILDLLHRSSKHRELKLAWYTGQNEIPGLPVLVYLDYVKVGPYIDEFGPLTSKTTNQRLFKVEHFYTPRFMSGKDICSPSVQLYDITSRFWKEKAS